jgi:hypothetical protein
VLVPAAWNVPISGASSIRSAVAGGDGANGSCRFTTSNASSHRARIVRSCAGRSGANVAIEPFASTGIELPSGMTAGSGGAPSQGPRTRTS